MKDPHADRTRVLLHRAAVVIRCPAGERCLVGLVLDGDPPRLYLTTHGVPEAYTRAVLKDSGLDVGEIEWRMDEARLSHHLEQVGEDPWSTPDRVLMKVTCGCSLVAIHYADLRGALEETRRTRRQKTTRARPTR